MVQADSLRHAGQLARRHGSVLCDQGRTIVGKYIPVLLAVSLFVTAGFQHSPANMGFFSLSIASGEGPGWTQAFVWNLIPAGIGNIIGGTLLVALPFWYLYGRKTSPQPTENS